MPEHTTTTPKAGLRRKAAAERHDISESYLRKLARVGGGPPFYKLGRHCVIYPVPELDAWAASFLRRNTSDKGGADAAA